MGYTTPEEIQDLFQFLTTEIDGADKAIFSAHCHDDLGLAVANSLAAVRGGRGKLNARSTVLVSAQAIARPKKSLWRLIREKIFTAYRHG